MSSFKKFITAKLLILLLMPVVYYIVLSGFNSNSESNTNTASVNTIPSPQQQGKDFINCIFNNAPTDSMYINPNRWCWTIEGNISRYNELNFDAVHTYMDADPYSTTGNTGTDWFGRIRITKNTEQINHFNNLMDAVSAGGLRGIYSQVNITNFCYGQSLVYEAEGGNWGFSYGTRRGLTEQDGNRTVLHACTANCNEWDATPRYILENITENLQHTDRNSGRPNDLGNWKIRPMMKTSANISDDIEIAKIVVYNFAGQPYYTVTLRGWNIKVGGNYNGEYTDNFRFKQDIDSMQVSGSTNGGLNEGWDDWSPSWDDSCHVDFKVYWYGQTDVWIDYVAVNDELGEELLNHDADPYILQEAQEFAQHNSNFSFFTDEVTFANVPCINYIKNLIAPYDGKLMCALNQCHNLRSQKDNTACFAPIMSKLNLPYYDINDLEIIETFLPPAFYDIDSIPHLNPLWKTTNNGDYTASFQLKILGDKSSNSITLDENEFYNHSEEQMRFIPSSRGTFVYQLEKAKQQRDQYSPDSKIIFQPQLQGFMTPDGNTFRFDNVREPTNEEIQAQAMIAIAHGVDGLCWFMLQSGSWTEGSNPYGNTGDYCNWISTLDGRMN